jgi:hypothetical protein
LPLAGTIDVLWQPVAVVSVFDEVALASGGAGWQAMAAFSHPAWLPSFQRIESAGS